MRKFVTPVRATAGASNSSAIETSRPGELPRLRARRLSFEKPQYRFILHDRDAIFSPGFDESLSHLDLEIVTTPVRSPQANALCERLIGTLRWECLDWIIPLTEDHLRRTLWSWLPHYNRGRPHTSLGPGFPVPRRTGATPAASLRPAQPRGGAPRLERTSPRVQPLGPRGLKVVKFLRTTHS